MREFAEEVMLIEEFLNPSTVSCHQVYITFPKSIGAKERAKAEDFTEKARKLRQESDQLRIIEPSLQQRRQRVAEAKAEKAFSVQVTRKGVEPRTSNDYVFSVNTQELGIEVTKIYRLDMDRCGANYVLCGEIGSDGRSLLRSPTILLSLKFLRELWEDNGRKFGPPSTKTQDQDGCVLLQRTPIGKIAKEGADYSECDYVLFDYDLNRERRNPNDVLTDPFDKIVHEGKIADERYRTLCPVTWKTLEIAFARDLIRAPAYW